AVCIAEYLHTALGNSIQRQGEMVQQFGCRSGAILSGEHDSDGEGIEFAREHAAQESEFGDFIEPNRVFHDCPPGETVQSPIPRIEKFTVDSDRGFVERKPGEDRWAL